MPYLVESIRGPLQHLTTALVHELPRLLPPLRITRTRPSGRRRAEPVHLAVEVATPTRRRRRLFVEVKAAAFPSRVRERLRELKTATRRSPNGYPILASWFLSPRVREICREEGVGYVDLAGNCWLQFDDFYLERQVEKNPFPARGRPASVFWPVSSRIVRALLEEPTRAWQVSELAREAQVSLGQSSNVTRVLRQEAYLELVERRLRLREPARLLEAWRDHGDLPHARAHAYYSFEREPQAIMRRVAEAARTHGLRYAFTSLSGASLVAPFVHGIGAVHWYIEDEATRERWVSAMDLRPVESGPNAVLLVPDDAGVFYRSQRVGALAVVGSIQLYLDLWGDPGRGREQAEFLRQEKIRF